VAAPVAAPGIHDRRWFKTVRKQTGHPVPELQENR
jgi:hypothetical protein